jgi:hypothetical protein
LYSEQVSWLPKWIAQLSLAWLLIGCSEGAGPSLLEVTDLSPRSWEAGDLVALKGAGFPEGKAATVTLEGTLYRAGLPNVEGYRVTFDAHGESNHEVSFAVSDELDDALSESDEHTAHATFRGRAVVSFAPRIAGAPPISGELGDLTVELFSARDPNELANEVDGARRLTELLGMTVEPGERALKVANVVPGRAQRAGLIVGDVIVSANGVSVFNATDLLPARQEREVQLSIKRAQAANPWPVRLSIDGFSPLLPVAFNWIFAIVATVAVWLVLLFSTIRSNGLLSIGSIANPQPKARAADAWWLAVAIGLGGALLSMAPLNGIASRLQNTLPLAAILLLRPLLGFLAHRSKTRAFPLRRATGDALKIQALELCTLLGLWPVLLQSGGLGAEELRAAQGAWPLQWFAFRSLATALAAVLYLLSCVYDASGRAETPLLTLRANGGNGLLHIDSALVFIKCAMFVTVFLGSGLHAFHGAGASGVLSALLFGLKYAVVLIVVMSARLRLGYPSRSTISKSFYLAFIWSIAVSALPSIGHRWGGSALAEWVRQSLPLALGLTALSGILLLGRSRSTPPARGTAINPWL